ncbi:hypothetical protein DID88_010102 [Monilinia fructigena]|uniref:Uncharacterized protein n=1 Tax=Monilinia fructigena TaxID=38457 RepID=A0A395ILI4_9HELO|nr:hypothetical protein DID88_010102 [Monilinia fructigena]
MSGNVEELFEEDQTYEDAPSAHLLINAPELSDIVSAQTSSATLSFTTIYFAGEACDGRLPDESVKQHHVIVMKRGGCTFSEKLSNIPSYTPTSKGLKLVIMVTDDKGDADSSEEDTEDHGGSTRREQDLFRPLLDKTTTNSKWPSETSSNQYGNE